MSGYNADWGIPIDPHTRKFTDYDTVLNVPRTATTKEIESAYRKLSLKCHPDKNPSRAAREQFLRLGKAKEVLCDSEEREWYDYALRQEALGFPGDGDEQRHRSRDSGRRRSESRTDHRHHRRQHHGHHGQGRRSRHGNESSTGPSSFWGTSESGSGHQNPFGGGFAFDEEMISGFDPFSFMGFNPHGSGSGHDNRQSRGTHRGPSSFFESTSRRGDHHHEPFSFPGFAGHRGHHIPRDHHHRHHHDDKTHRNHETAHDLSSFPGFPSYSHVHDPFSSPFFESTPHAHRSRRNTNTQNPPPPSSEPTSRPHHHDRARRHRRRRDTQQSHDTPHDSFSFPGCSSHGGGHGHDPFSSFFESTSHGMPHMPHMPSPFTESTSHGNNNNHRGTRRDRNRESEIPHDPFSFFESTSRGHSHGSFPFPFPFLEFPTYDDGHGTQQRQRRRRDSFRRRHR